MRSVCANDMSVVCIMVPMQRMYVVYLPIQKAKNNTKSNGANSRVETQESGTTLIRIMLCCFLCPMTRFLLFFSVKRNEKHLAYQVDDLEVEHRR